MKKITFLLFLLSSIFTNVTAQTVIADENFDAIEDYELPNRMGACL